MGKMPEPPARDLAERIHMSPQAMRSLGYRVVDLLVEHWTHLEEKPVTRVAERAGRGPGGQEAGVVLVRQARWLKNTFGARHEYMRDSETVDTEQVNFCDYGIQLTRAVRALKLWMTIKVFGLENMRKAIQRGMDYARRVQAMLERAGCFEVISPARLGIVVFRYATQPPSLSDKVNSAIVAACIEEGFTFPSSTELEGRTVLRMYTINPRTTVEDLQATVDTLKELGSKLEQAQSD